MSSSVVNDFLSALFDNNTTSEAESSSQASSSKGKGVALSSITPSEEVSYHVIQVKEGGTGIKRQHEEEGNHEVTVDQPDTKRLATEKATASLEKDDQPVRQSSAPKPQYQPFQQQLLGSSVLSDPYDAYIASQASTSHQPNSSKQKGTQKHISSPSTITRDSSSTNDKDEDSHVLYATKNVIGKLPAESRMFIKKLPSAVTPDDIVKHFSQYGRVLEVVRKCQLGSFFGFVQFDSVAACRRAIENEKGKSFQSVKLVLEPCHKAKHGNRPHEDADQNIQGNRQNYNRKSAPLPQYNQAPRQGRPKPSQQKRKNRQQNRNNKTWNQGTNRRQESGYKAGPHDQPRQFNNNRNQRGGQNNPQRYNDDFTRGPNGSDWPMPKRYGEAVPVVELVVWDMVSESFITFIEDRFRTNRLKIHTSYLHHNDVKTDTLMQHFVMEGVTAVVMVDSLDEAQGQVYMQVFARSPGADASHVRYDEYAAISVDDAVAIVARAKDQPANPMVLTQSFSQPTSSQAPSHPAPMPHNLQQPTRYASPLAQPVVTQPAAPAIDVNAVAALLGIVQNAAKPNTVSDPGMNNAAIQLLASLVSNTTATNINTNVNTSITMPPHILPQPSPIPQQYDPAYSQLTYSPQSTPAYNTNGHSPHVQSAYTTVAQPASPSYAAHRDNSWYANGNQNTAYYSNYNSSQGQREALSVTQAGNTSATMTEILAKLQILQQQGQQK